MFMYVVTLSVFGYISKGHKDYNAELGFNQFIPTPEHEVWCIFNVCNVIFCERWDFKKAPIPHSLGVNYFSFPVSMNLPLE